MNIIKHRGDFTTWLVLDGYEDEPAAFGVPPYVGFHVRYICGVLEERQIDYKYMTIDKWRNLKYQQDSKKILLQFQGIVILAGAIVPGKYVRGTPISRREVDDIINTAPQTIPILCGGWAIRGWRHEGWSAIRVGLFLAHHDLDATLDYFLKTGLFSHKKRNHLQWDKWALAGAKSKAITHHPDFPEPLIMEIELYQGCVRFKRGCRFCIEPKKGVPINRTLDSVLSEIYAALDSGIKNIRIGGATCIYTWLAEGVGELEYPRPNPDPIIELLTTIRADKRVELLHVDNANPSIIASNLERAEPITKVLAETLTDGAVLSFGLESADPDVHNKNWLNCDSEQFKIAVRHINKYGSKRGKRGLPKLLPGVNLIAGLHGESDQTWEHNLQLFKEIIDEGLLIRRVNIRQVEGRGFPEINSKRFSKAKKTLREVVDAPMLEKIAPIGQILKKVRWETHNDRIRRPKEVEGDSSRDDACRGKPGVTFGRQAGAYPILIGVPYLIPLESTSDIIVTGHGFRSITGVEIGLDPLNVTKAQLKAIPGIGEKRAWKMISERAHAKGKGFETPKGFSIYNEENVRPWLDLVMK